VLLKREDQQPVFSFKLRGAYNKMAHLAPEQLRSGVICASAGNHAQGVALAARKLGCRAVIVMPVTTPRSRSTPCRPSAARWCCTATAIPTPTARARPCRRPSAA
jgi:threonine dehydratase